MNEFLKGGLKEMDPMDIGEYQESVRKDFKALAERFEQNFNNLDIERLAEFKTKVADLIDLLRTRGRRDY